MGRGKGDLWATFHPNSGQGQVPVSVSSKRTVAMAVDLSSLCLKMCKMGKEESDFSASIHLYCFKILFKKGEFAYVIRFRQELGDRVSSLLLLILSLVHKTVFTLPLEMPISFQSFADQLYVVCCPTPPPPLLWLCPSPTAPLCNIFLEYRKKDPKTKW